MALSQSRYVDINSSVAAQAQETTRQLVARLISENPLIPTGEVLTFTNVNDVETYFGSSSTEYAYAEAYFGWQSKNGTTPPSLQFIFWPANAVASRIYGLEGAQVYTSYTGISAGSFTLQMGANTFTLSGLNFTSCTSLAQVAAVIQTAINAESAGGNLWTSATVTWDSARQSFDLNGGTGGAATIAVTAGTGGSDVAAQLGWLSPLTILSFGSASESITALLTNFTAANNNFGSFAFLSTLNLNQAQIVEAATWNDAQNNMFMYSVGVSTANAATYQAALANLSGVGLTISNISTEYPELIPMMILAATDYTQRNAVQNYEFQNGFDCSASVTVDSVADTYDAIRVNYYGNVQQAGQYVSFYQQGNLQGGAEDAIPMNVYANEMWLKDACQVALMNLLLALPQIPASNTGTAQVLSQLQSIIAQGLFNGTIEVGKALTSEQQLYITTITGLQNAWQQVQNQGYWVGAQIVPYGSSPVRYKIVYTLLYSKNDTINLIQGNDILI